MSALVTAACARHRPFGTKAEALAMLALMRARGRGGQGLAAWLCPLGQHWHVGRSARRRSRRR